MQVLRNIIDYLQRIYSSRTKFLNLVFIIIIVVIGFILRIHYVLTTELVPIDGLDFMRAAQWMLGRETLEQFAHIPREPGWSIILAIGFIALPSDYTTLFFAARIYSVIFSCVQIFLTFYVASSFADRFERTKGKGVLLGIISAFFVAFNPRLILAAGGGLREPLQTTLFLAWIYLYQSWGTDRKFIIASGAISFYSVLVRLDTMLLFIFLSLILVYKSWYKESSFSILDTLRRIIIMSVPSVLAFLSWFVACFFIFVDPYITQSIFLESYYRREFNVPVSEVPDDLSLSTYLFKYHTLSELAISFVRGCSSLFKMLIGYLDILLGSLVLIAMIFYIYKEKLILPGFVIYGIGFYAIFAHFWGYSGYWRLLSPYLNILIIMVSTILVGYVKEFKVHLPKGKSFVLPAYFLLLVFATLVVGAWAFGFYLS